MGPEEMTGGRETARKETTFPYCSVPWPVETFFVAVVFKSDNTEFLKHVLRHIC